MSAGNIGPGSVDQDRKRCRCHCCEEVFNFEPSWTYEQACPSCEEQLLKYICPECQYVYPGPAPDQPPLPGMPCDECGRTAEDRREEEGREERIREESERVERAAEFREAKERGIYRNRIGATYNSPGSLAAPESESDALRMAPPVWDRLRPLIVREMEAQKGVDPSTVLNIGWCQAAIQYFERSWQDENMEGLETGVYHDVTGNVYLTLDKSQTTVRLRILREGHAEEGTLPTAPAVTIEHDGLDDDPVVTWDPAWEGEDAREIYQRDGKTSLSLGEFLVWSARIGGFGAQPFNPRWVSEDGRGGKTAEPIAYVPTDWCGRPKMWAEEETAGFRRWHWMRTQGKIMPLKEVVAKSRENMQVCCVCYGKPQDAQVLVPCECGETLYCSSECRDSHREIHCLDTKVRHPSAARICLNCGEEKAGMNMCSRCRDCFFCDRECQKLSWKTHKKVCKQRDRDEGNAGMPSWYKPNPAIREQMLQFLDS